MRTHLILVLVSAACLCVLAAGEAVRRADARRFADREALMLAGQAAEEDREKIEAALAATRDREKELRAAVKRTAVAERVRDSIQAELLAANDRLEKAYKDIAEMEKQLVDVSRLKNDLEQELSDLRRGHRPPPYEPLEPKIDGVVLGVSEKVNLILISVGDKDKVAVGMKFTVYRDSVYVSKIVVDKVEDGWAACRELTDFRKEAIQQGDEVSTRVFD